MSERTLSMHYSPYLQSFYNIQLFHWVPLPILFWTAPYGVLNMLFASAQFPKLLHWNLFSQHSHIWLLSWSLSSFKHKRLSYVHKTKPRHKLTVSKQALLNSFFFCNYLYYFHKNWKEPGIGLQEILWAFSKALKVFSLSSQQFLWQREKIGQWIISD